MSICAPALPPAAGPGARHSQRGRPLGARWTRLLSRPPSPAAGAARCRVCWDAVAPCAHSAPWPVYGAAPQALSALCRGRVTGWPHEPGLGWSGWLLDECALPLAARAANERQTYSFIHAGKPPRQHAHGLHICPAGVFCLCIAGMREHQMHTMSYLSMHLGPAHVYVVPVHFTSPCA